MAWARPPSSALAQRPHKPGDFLLWPQKPSTSLWERQQLTRPELLLRCPHPLSFFSFQETRRSQLITERNQSGYHSSCTSSASQNAVHPKHSTSPEDPSFLQLPSKANQSPLLHQPLYMSSHSFLHLEGAETGSGGPRSSVLGELGAAAEGWRGVGWVSAGALWWAQFQFACQPGAANLGSSVRDKFPRNKTLLKLIYSYSQTITFVPNYHECKWPLV